MVDLAELSSGGEMGELIRATDWSQTSLGRVETWPKSLRTMLGVVLGSRFPMLLWWGPDLLHLYNDAYRPILRDKHPGALGAPAATIWAEVWDVAGPMANGVLAGGAATWTEDLQLFIHNGAMAEETYFTFSYSPVPGDDGRVGGVLNTVQETTEKVQGERQIRMLHELALGAASAKSEAEAYRIVSDVLSGNELDLPFALLYEVDVGNSCARLVGRTESFAGPACVERIALDDAAAEPGARTWPFASVLADAHDLVVDDLRARFGSLPVGRWGASPERAMILPLMRPGQSASHAILVAGVSPHRVLDDRYRRFFRATADQALAVLTMAAGYEAETKRAEALAEIDRAKTTFFSNVSHEFRTPLTLILGPIEDALASTNGAIAGEALQMVHRNTLRLMRLVNSLLDFARIESGRADALFVPTDLATTTANLASAFRSAVERNGVELRVDCEPLDEDVYVDREQWEKIVLNLLSNALKFTFEGSIRVSLRIRDESVELVVSDTGTGIPEGDLPRIFDRFHQVRGARSRTHEGSGIGLALVRDLVRLHGGEVSATSRLGEGTTFVVTIPRGYAHLPSAKIGTGHVPRVSTAVTTFVDESLRWAGRSVDESSSPAGRAKDARPRAGRILVVDDNADLRDYMVELLEDAYEVDIGTNGLDALAKARRTRPDLVLSDVMMPELDGFGLLRALREDPCLRDVSVILLSARAGEDATVDGLAAGADDYLVKPFASRELLARVRTHIALARQREELGRLNTLLASSNEELARSTQAKSDFLAMMSHELRTPLNAIIGFSEILIDRKFGELNDRQARYLRNVLDGGRHLLTLINELLDLSKVEAGRLEIVASSCAPFTLVTDAVATLRPLASTKGISLSIERDASGLPPLFVDSLRAKQVVYNLLSNAIKFTPSGGRVSVRFDRPSATMLRIGVRDTGPGIKPEEIGSLFRPFSQLESGRASGVGTGLGLALTKQLVELMGGTVGVESTYSVGSYFFVDLPIDLAFVSESESTEAVAGDPPLALIVDDDEAARELLELTLRAEGYRVISTSSGEEALVSARRHRPALITLDVFLPGIDGWEVLRAIRGDPSTADIPVVMVTISSERRTAFGLGAVEHLVKPVDRSLLLSALARRNFTAKLNDGPVHVLVVDDDAAHRALMRAALEPSGFVVTTVGTGREAISVARSGAVDLVLLDLVLPDISGIEVVQAIRMDVRARNVPILLVTASEIDEAARIRLNGDVASVLEKATLDVSALKGEIDRVVRRPS